MHKQSSSVALITGAGTGIGLAIVERLIREEWRVIVVGRRIDLLENLQTRFGADRVLAVACDVSKDVEVQALAAVVRESANLTFGRSLKAVINNAGIYERQMFDSTSDEHWLKMFETNLFGAVRITRAFLPELKSTRGCVLNIASTLGLHAVAGNGAYSASKAAMISWTETLALELGSFGVRANVVCPGIVDTPIHAFHGRGQSEKDSLKAMQPLGRIGEANDVAHAAWSLLAPGSEWMTGSVLKVDGGIDLV